MGQAGARRASLIDRALGLNAIAAIDKGAFPQGDAPCVLVKDNIAVAGMQWTAGTPILADVVADRDAMAVRLLRAAGARFPIKTTLHELAFGVTGANGWTGAIANPHSPTRMAGGSSGGSASALAIGLGDLSLVTDTGGSARIPAAHCGIFGFRPSMGRYPMDGVIGLSPSRDTIGLMARELRWIVWADDLLRGTPVNSDVLSTGVPRIGILPEAELIDVQPAIANAYRVLCQQLIQIGWQVSPIDLSAVMALDEACGFPIALHETYQSLLMSVPTLSGKSFADLLASVATPDVAHLLHMAARQEVVSAAAYAQAIGQDWPALRNAYAKLFASGVDFLLTPTVPMTAAPIGQDANVTLNGRSAPTFPTFTRFTRPDSMAGLPSMSMPFGQDGEGMPIGMMISGPRFADRAVLACAKALVERTRIDAIAV
ncbi:indoleacetamide hydrolase [soil metagenome]